MKTRFKTALQLILFLLLAAAAIYYVIFNSPLDSLEQHSNNSVSRSSDYSTAPPERSADDVSLTGAKGRYDESRIGRKE